MSKGIHKQNMKRQSLLEVVLEFVVVKVRLGGPKFNGGFK